MKLRAIFLLATFAFIVNLTKAQNSTNQWTPVLVSMDGTNTYNGVELNYQLTKCGADDVVLLKITNTNPYAVKAHWINVIKTKDGKELYGNSKLASVTLSANSESTGGCKSKPTELKIKLSDFGTTSSNFETIVGSSFDTTKK